MLSTKRLYLKSFKHDDNKFLYKLNNNRKVNRYLSADSVSIKDCNNMINKWIKKYGDDSIFNVHKVMLKGTEEIIGFVCLKKDTNKREAELGYSFIPKYWGKGYCIEIAKELIECAFEKTEVERIVAETHPENERSISLLRRLNFKEDNRYGEHFGKLYYLDGIDLSSFNENK
ncbi:MAG: GNAT family N-acetyltransferase [Firmicutes bacterium]|nr:GNAT family N-acetyltransferase [Bacillota bacterium]